MSGTSPEFMDQPVLTSEKGGVNCPIVPECDPQLAFREGGIEVAGCGVEMAPA
jgi:hypothetical protein